MPNCYHPPNNDTPLAFWGGQTPASLQDIDQGLVRAWRLMLMSQSSQALRVVEAVDRQIDNLSPALATRYRAVSLLVRSAVLAFEDDSLAALTIVISEALVKGGARLASLLAEATGRLEGLELAEKRSGNGPRQPNFSADAITARERDVLALLSEGYSNKRIARTLEISPETVKSHLKRIFSKLSVSTRNEAVFRAMSRRMQ